MKCNMTLMLMMLASAAVNSHAQCRVDMGSGTAITTCGGWAVRPGFPHCGRGRWVPDYYGYRWDSECAGDYYAPQQSIVVVTAAPQPHTPAPASTPSTPAAVMHEYRWPNPGEDSGTEFAIVSNDGAIQHAVAVWLQDGWICFVTPEGTARQLSPAEVDRQKTAQMNGQKKLKLLSIHNAQLAATNPHTSE